MSNQLSLKDFFQQSASAQNNNSRGQKRPPSFEEDNEDTIQHPSVSPPRPPD
ncbi:unnamed protein product [Knipowitschia caucasica]